MFTSCIFTKKPSKINIPAIFRSFPAMWMNKTGSEFSYYEINYSGLYRPEYIPCAVYRISFPFSIL